MGRKTEATRASTARDKIHIHIADDHNHADTGSFVGLVGAEQGVENLVDLVFIEEVIRIIERDEQHNLIFYQDAGNSIEYLLEGGAG